MSEEKTTQAAGRVTLYEDGVYRWTYEYHMMRNPVIYAMVAKIFLWITIPMGLFFMLMGNVGRVPGYVIALIIVAGFQALWGLIYLIWALCVRGVYRMHFEMNDEAVALVPSQAARNVTDAAELLGTVVGVIGIVSGHPVRGGANAAALRAANSNGIVHFRSVNRVGEKRRKHGELYLREFLGGLQVFVNPEDYDLVRDYILERAPEQRDNAEARAARIKRLVLASAGSLAVNLVTLVVNLKSFEATGGWLKWAYSYRGGDYGQQRAFALLVDDWYFKDPVEHHLSFYLPYAVIGFLAVALVFYILLWLVSLLTRDRREVKEKEK